MRGYLGLGHHNSFYDHCPAGTREGQQKYFALDAQALDAAGFDFSWRNTKGECDMWMTDTLCLYTSIPVAGTGTFRPPTKEELDEAEQSMAGNRADRVVFETLRVVDKSEVSCLSPF